MLKKLRKTSKVKANTTIYNLYFAKLKDNDKELPTFDII